MFVGTVKWYDYRKGYGFIVTPQGDDVMAHFAVIEGDGFRRLYHGEPVEYEVTRGPNGLQATFVRRLKKERKDGRPSIPTPRQQPPALPRHGLNRNNGIA